VVLKQLGLVDYVASIPDHRKSKRVHILKKYHERDLQARLSDFTDRTWSGWFGDISI